MEDKKLKEYIKSINEKKHKQVINDCVINFRNEEKIIKCIKKRIEEK